MEEARFGIAAWQEQQKRGGRKLTCAVDADEQILNWVLEQRDLNLPVTTENITVYK